MNNQYFPIVRAKKGELDAFAKLDKAALGRCTPIFEITKLDGLDLERARKRSNTPYEDYLESRIQSIAEVFNGLHVIVDASQWSPEFTTEGGEHVMSFVVTRLTSLGVIACPAVGYDRWDSPEYQQTLRMIGSTLASNAFFCVRLDSLAIEDLGDPDHLIEVLESMVNVTGMVESATPVLIDLGDITQTSVQEVMESVEDAYGHIKAMGFGYAVMSGSSIPDSIEKAVKARDTNGLVQRKEMLVWKGFMSANPQASLYFGDYGVRNPRSSDIIATNMNVKIRYTIENAFFIARGHSVKEADGYSQSQHLSRVVMASPHYKGASFSWGDLKIMECGSGKLVGSSTSWISYDTNHHMKVVINELYEFAAQLAAITARV